LPAAKILETAQKENADIVGLSGLITPSLDEMCHVAAEMERQGFDLPLLIGGREPPAAFIPAVKIHPNYRRGQTVYVNDASRVGRRRPKSHVGAEPPKYVADIRQEYARIAAAHARGEANKQRVSLKDARANALKLNWSGNYVRPRRASRLAVLENYPIDELRVYIDWTPFFATGADRQVSCDLDDAKYVRRRAVFR